MVTVLDSLPGYLTPNIQQEGVAKFRAILDTLGELHLLGLHARCGTDASTLPGVCPTQGGEVQLDDEAPVQLHNGCATWLTAGCVLAATTGAVPSMTATPQESANVEYGLRVVLAEALLLRS